MTTTSKKEHPSPDEPSAGLPKAYNPADHEDRIRLRWESARAFHADPKKVLSGEKPPYCVLIPPPNVTGALHLGHALNNTLQDILVRMHRMKGHETLWMPGSDHAGIATQTVVEKRILAQGGKPRIQWDRDAFIARVQEWKDEYEARITNQLTLMGSSCDWDRQRFTMDDVCAKAVREAFFQLFKAGLIERGKRLVNWDPVTQTALADDEVDMIEVEGAFYYMRYPLCDKDGKPVSVTFPDGQTVETITVATTRPETYLGDTAIAVNPDDPRAPALRGLYVKLPLVGRIIPIIEDDYVVLPDPDGSDPKAKYATGFLKVTPAHDENDWLIGQRHELEAINVLAPDASISDQHGWSDVGEAAIFVGLSREDAREKVVKEFESRGLLEEVKPYVHSVGHSYRSHAMIEPYLSDQWYVKVSDDRLVGEAQRALSSTQQSGHSKWLKNQQEPSGVAQLSGLCHPGAQHPTNGDGGVSIYPERYAKTYEAWHENLRDWCISRQLWWGHRIPVYTAGVNYSADIPDILSNPQQFLDEFNNRLREYAACFDAQDDLSAQDAGFIDTPSKHCLYICARNDTAAQAWERIARYLNEAPSTNTINPLDFFPTANSWNKALPVTKMLAYEQAPLEQDPDVLDTWFSSALWPLSTMGWPDPAQDERFTGLLEAFKPTNVLCTARDIITLWVSRMVMFNRFFTGDGQVPFHHVYIHPVIQDGDGKRMSKSAGNGVDPLDIIHTHGADAMRFTLCQLASQTQDVRMPIVHDEKTGRNTSPKFDLGKRLCNKLWNASRFTMMMLAESTTSSQVENNTNLNAGAEHTAQRAVPPRDLPLVDRWMLSRLAHAIERIESALERYEFNVYTDIVYDLLWNEFCDWHLEAIKPTVKENADQQCVLRSVLDCLLRLLHPVAPFVTEAIYEELRRSRPLPAPAGLTLGDSDLLCLAPWPTIDPAWRDTEVESQFAELQGLIGAIREARSQHKVLPKQRITLHTTGAMLSQIESAGGIVETLAGLEAVTSLEPDSDSTPFTHNGVEHRLSGLSEQMDASTLHDSLEKSLSEVDSAIALLEKRLSNPGYTDKAPAKLVQQTRDQLADKKAERDAIAASLAKL